MRKILETPRLVLRELVPGDYAGICAMLQDGRVMYAYEGAFSDREAHDWLDRQIARYRDDGFGLWAVIEKSSGRIVGQCGITMQELCGRRVPEVGYLLCHDCWHCGFATEAAVACRDYGFDVLGFGEIYSIIRDTNKASQRVASRVGMERTVTVVRHYRGVVMPHYVFTVSKEKVLSGRWQD